jgi:hypothetical protein
LVAIDVTSIRRSMIALVPVDLVLQRSPGSPNITGLTILARSTNRLRMNTAQL